MKVSPTLARRIALHAQLLDGRHGFPSGKEGVARVIETLGYIQIDTIAVIKRAHHHTLWSRRRDYDIDMLHDLQTRDRRIFEYLGHALSYLPMVDYRFYLKRMQAFHDPYGKWEKERLTKYGHLMEPALECIEKEGPSISREIASSLGTKKTSPDMREPTRSAMELLFLRGDLMVAERRNFERVYDLTERVLPEEIDTRVPKDDELGRFLVKRALSAHGIAHVNDICQHIHAADREVVVDALYDLVEAGEVTSVNLGEGNGYYALTGSFAALKRLRGKKPAVTLLSPFDNLIINRDRVKRLFGFDYSLECYVTPAKRVYGYFVLPILWDERLVGRLDPKADRKTKTLIVRNLFLEDSFTGDDQFLEALASSLAEFAAFNDCDTIAVEKTTPGTMKKKLQEAIKKQTC